MVNYEYTEVLEETQAPLDYEIADEPILEVGGTANTPRGLGTVDIITINPYGGAHLAAYIFSVDPKNVWGDWFELDEIEAI